MKIIELLNKIANGEEVPKKIKFNLPNYDKEFYFDGDIYKYKDNYNEYAMTDDLSIEMSLNDEIEIIEEDKKIEKLESYVDEEGYLKVEGFEDNREQILQIVNKINEIIDKIEE